MLFTRFRGPVFANEPIRSFFVLLGVQNRGNSVYRYLHAIPDYRRTTSMIISYGAVVPEDSFQQLLLASRGFSSRARLFIGSPRHLWTRHL